MYYLRNATAHKWCMIFRNFKKHNTNFSTQPIAHAAPHTHRVALELLKEDGVGIILDAAAGEGAASIKLKEMGFNVYAADLDEKDFKIEGIRFNKVDLNKPLIYDDNFFNYIICLEAIEHLENPHQLIREFARILKPSGKLIISTPNILNIYSRLRYLLIGYSDWMHSLINLPKEQKTFRIAKERNVTAQERTYDMLEQHINMIGFPELYYILTNNNFQIEKITVNQNILSYPWGRAYLRPIIGGIFLFLALFVKFFGKIIKRNVILSNYLLSNELLYGWEIIIKAKKIP